MILYHLDVSQAAIVAHDAGGAEVLSSLLRRLGSDCPCVLAGPAVSVFSRKLPDARRADLRQALDCSNWLLCGTGWQSEFEIDAIDAARAAGKSVVAFLDHWVNFRARFVRGERVSLPDEVWVADEHAEALAKVELPEVAVRRVADPYLADMRDQCAREGAGRAGAASALFVCEPLREHAQRQHGDERHWGFVEEEALRYFLTQLPGIQPSVERLVIRPHPSEPVDKYDWAASESPVPVVRGGTRSLVEEIADAALVVGCESMALVVALVAGKRVLSCIPPGGKPCVLPHPEIEFLRGYR